PRVALTGRVGAFRIVFRGHDGNGRRRTRHLAQLAADAHLQPVAVAAQLVAPAEPLGARLLLVRVRDGLFLAEQNAQGRSHALGDRLQHSASLLAPNPAPAQPHSATPAAVTTKFRNDSGSITFQPKSIKRS